MDWHGDTSGGEDLRGETTQSTEPDRSAQPLSRTRSSGVRVHPKIRVQAPDDVYSVLSSAKSERPWQLFMPPVARGDTRDADRRESALPAHDGRRESDGRM